MLPKKYRLTDRKILSGMYRLGTKVRAEHGMLVGLKTNTEKAPQISFVISKKIGKANIRNKFRRQLSAIFYALVEKALSHYNNDNISRETVNHATNPSCEILGLQFQYVAYKKPEDFNKLYKEFQWQLNRVTDQVLTSSRKINSKV